MLKVPTETRVQAAELGQWPVGTVLSPQQEAKLPQRRECNSLSHMLSFVMTFSGMMLIGRESSTGSIDPQPPQPPKSRSSLLLFTGYFETNPRHFLTVYKYSA